MDLLFPQDASVHREIPRKCQDLESARASCKMVSAQLSFKQNKSKKLHLVCDWNQAVRHFIYSSLQFNS